MIIDPVTRDMIALALREDVGPGDVTSRIIPTTVKGSAHLLAKQELVLAGGDAVVEVFRQVDPEVQIRFERTEGTKVENGAVFAHLEGRAHSLLVGERLALNILQRMCGIATFARRCADALVGTSARVVDTRKTTPGMRALEKYAVRMGGGSNHRFGLFDGILIKDNHIAALGSLRAAIAEARALNHHLLKVEVEVSSLEDLEKAIKSGADVVLLDNMPTGQMEKAVALADGRVKLEASGNMTLDRLANVASTGVDYISMGALTHSAPSADISMKWST